MLGEFATYITNNVGHIVTYGERFRADGRISMGFVESAVNQIVDKRFDKRQSMRWGPSGRSSAASDPNTRPQRRSRSTHPSPLPSVQENGRQRPCPRFVMGSTGGSHDTGGSPFATWYTPLPTEVAIPVR
jgi:hypothetical protein